MVVVAVVVVSGRGGGGHLHSSAEREELMWDEHIRLFIRPIYFQPSGFMVIGKALPSRSFPEGVNISPSPSFLPLCLFFSNSIFSPKHHSLPSVHRQGMLEGTRKETKHERKARSSAHTQTRMRERGANRDPVKTRDISHFLCLITLIHHCLLVLLTDASLSLSLHGSCGALETDCGLFTRLMFANDF